MVHESYKIAYLADEYNYLKKITCTKPIMNYLNENPSITGLVTINLTLTETNGIRDQTESAPKPTDVSVKELKYLSFLLLRFLT